MAFLGSSKPKTVLGVDIGASSIKLVELLPEKGRARLMTYGYVELPPELADDALFDQPQKAGELLAQLCKESGVRATQAMTSLQTATVFSAMLTLPKSDDQKAMKSLIDAEMAKLSPLPVSEMITYSTVVDGDSEKSDTKKEEKQKYAHVLVTGGAKTMVAKYVNLFKVAKLNLQAIDTEAFAHIRSLIGKDKGSILILDLGAKRTNLFVVERGIPFVQRSMNLGGETMTKRLSEQLKISEQDAERAKRDLGLGGEGELPKALEPLMQPIVNEIRFALQLFANMELTVVKRVEKILLTGGGSHLVGVPEYLSHVLNMNVYRGDPWARIVYPKDLEGVLEEIGPRLSVAVGLAMREME